MTTLLLLYTEPPTRRVFAKHRPGRLILASDEISDEDRRIYDECLQLPPITDLEGTLAALDRIKCDRLVIQTEYGLLPGALLADRRGEPGPSPEAALLCTNKWLFRKTCEKHGVPVPRFALAESAADVQRFAERFPVVLKPVASTLQRLVTRVDSKADLEEKVAELRRGLPQAPDVLRCREFARLARLDLDCDPTRQFLVEDFVQGQPLETDGLIFGDNIDLFGVTEQVHTDSPHFYIEGYIFPVSGDGLKATSEAAIRAIGLKNAGFSIEFRGGTVIEVNGRLGEDEGFPDLFQAALGQYPILKWIDGNAAPSRPQGHFAVAYACWYAGGTVKSVSNDAGSTILVSPGRTLHAPPHPDVWPHLAYALASHPTSSHAAYQIAREKVSRVRFEIE